MRNVRIMFFVFLGALYVCLSAGATTLPKAAKLVPPETILLVEAEDFSQLQAQFEKTNLYKFYKDAAMADFVEDVKQKIRKEVVKLDENNLMRVFYNTGLYPQGRVAVALVFNERTKDANEPPVLIITQWADKVDKIKDMIKQLVQKNIDMGGRQRPAEDYKGVSIETLIDEHKAALSYCFVEDCLLGSFDPEILKFAVASIKGSDSSTLSGDADYSAGYPTSGPYHDVDFFVNIKQFTKMFVAEDASGDAKKYISGLGLDNVRSLSGSLGFSRVTGSGVVGKALLKIDGDKRGICKMLDCRQAQVQVPVFVPSSAYSLSVFNLDIKSAFDELVKVVNVFSPGAASVFYMPLLPASPDGGPTVELKRDIIDYLGSQIVSAEWPVKTSVDRLAESEGIFAVGVSNRSSLEKSLSLLHSKIIAPNKPDARRELLGHTIYIIDLPSLIPALGVSAGRPMIESSLGPNVQPLPRLSFTVTDTHLIFGTESAVEKAIRTLGNPGGGSINSEQWFTAAKSAVPSVVGLAGFGNSAAVWEELWRVLRRGTGGLQSGIISGPLGPSFLPSLSEEPFDFKLLPAFEVVRKYFGLIACYGISRPDGFYLELQYINQGS